MTPTPSSAVEFELTFEVSRMDDELEDRLMEQLDAFPSCRSGVWMVTLNQPATSGLSAAQAALQRLRHMGADPLRMVEDLVGRSEIAQRCGVTRQAVGQWMRGERHGALAAPSPLVTAGVDLWLWGEIVDWVREMGHTVDADLAFPSRSDHQIVNGIIAGSRGWTELPIVAREALDLRVDDGATVRTVLGSPSRYRGR